MPGDTTRFHIYGPDFTEIDIHHIELVLRDYGFNVSEESYETTIISTAFPADEKGMEEVDQIEEEIREWFTEYDIERSKGYSDRLAGSESVSYMVCFYIE
jgi:hypothetical protein